MHARRLIEEQPERLRAALEARRYEFDLDVLLARMASRKELRSELEQLQARRNSGSKQVGMLFKEGKRDEAQELREELGRNRKKLAQLENLRRM